MERNKPYQEIIVDVLKALGYQAHCNAKNDYYEIKFRTFNGGSDYMTDEDKSIIGLIAKENLIEFYYMNDVQFIYLKNK